MNINNEIEYIHKILKTEHHFFTETADRGVLLRLENNSALKYSFKGMTMVSAITETLSYIKQEISAGSLKDVTNDEAEIDGVEKEESNQSGFLDKFKKKKDGENK